MVGAGAILAPVFVQVALTFGLLFWAGLLRLEAVRTGEVKPHDVVLREPNWPRQAMQVLNAYQSQLELPVLFYLVMVFALFSGRPTVTLVVLGWLFVLSRLLHTLIHVTTNNLARRFILFATGSLILLVMWVLFLLDLYLGA